MTWNFTSLGVKEPELVREVDRYRLDILSLTSTHSLGSGSHLLERAWTLQNSGIANGERQQAGVTLLIALQLSRHMLEFSPVNERVTLYAFRLWIGLSLLSRPIGPTSVQSNQPSWSASEVLLYYALLLGDFNAHVSSHGNLDRGNLEEQPPRPEPEKCSVIVC